ncbi:LVIVD repeat-containing protein [Haladaptatus sp. CMSO5]|uniref:LVIVD repeat-containing protein n=1 Tax=Haladaptatus sp. CMSO5 TaxID=3120514 RepID=UPI002FCE519B
MRRRQVLQAAAAGAALPLFSNIGTAQESGYAPIARLDLPRAKEVVVSADGETAYVALTNGFAIVDVSSPANPTVLAEELGLLSDVEGGPLRGIYDVKIDGDTLLVAGPANPTASQNINALVIYDVSDPENPTQRAVYETNFFHHNVYLEGDTAYLGDNEHADIDTRRNELVIVDVSGEPEEVGRWSIADHDERWADINTSVWTLHDLYVKESIAYLVFWDAGTWIVDCSDPANPEYLGNVRTPDPDELAQLTDDQFRQMVFEPPGNDHYVTVNDDATVMGVGGESWDVDAADDTGGPSGIELFDISDKTAPESLAMIEPPESADATFQGTWTTSHNFDITGDRLYTSWYQGGVKIHDIADPASPEELAWWREPDETSFWTAQLAVSGEFFVATSHENPSASGANPANGAALYTFPDRAGEQANPPSLTETETPTATQTATQTTTTQTTTQTTTTTQSTTTTEETTTDTSGPGFGVPAAITGVGLGAWRYLRREE